MAKIYIGLGTNVDREEAVQEGARALKSVFRKTQFSPLYESEAVGFRGANFYNAVVSAETALAVDDVLRTLKRIESEFASPEQQAGMANKRLDLDLLLYDDLICIEPVELPRPEILFNAFVLLPLSELAPTLRHPVTDTSYFQHWQAFSNVSQKLWPVTTFDNKEWFE